MVAFVHIAPHKLCEGGGCFGVEGGNVMSLGEAARVLAIASW
jgi:hypothetical protein